MSDRMLIAAVLYPVCQSTLLGTGLAAAALLPSGVPLPLTLGRIAIASLVLAAPLAHALAPALQSARERQRR